ncbi:Calcium/calmodulin-dependent 3',5'-cyclic nucleotide phosphodiesterase 1B [Phytophthora pseudosyringae]|uniref:Phosphodiesterase n=1 Tax=Phytophthora pseudosyringae TaxID=221518 RepID=A0A8T1WJ90_9STRA|nr:Calcium/calmodulin-dependent 3',5'-cyclic nucleotide phosphodiesterase 1B [Phytophthora pseudosyringae]
MSGESSPSVPPPSAPAHPPSSACRPKRQTLSRFLRRSPYGERRSRAVAPADSAAHAHVPGADGLNRKRRGAGGNELTARRQSGVAHMRTMHRVRLAVGEFMRQLSVELFFVMIVLFYGVFVTVQLTMADDALSSYKLAIDVTDITVGSILLLEITLKVFAYGLHYLRDVWALFDALVIVVSFVLGIVAAMGTTSSVVVKILRLRVILRVLRVLVVFERVKQRSKSMNLMHLNKGAITSPVEHVLRVLNELRFHPAIRPSLRDGLDFAIDAIKNNRLYDANEELLAVEGVDDDTQNWLRGEMLRGSDMNKVLPDADEDNEDGPNRKRRRSSVGSSCSDVDGPQDVTSGSSDGSGAVGPKPQSPHRHHHEHSLTHANRGATMRNLLSTLDSASEFELQNLLQGVNSWNFDVFRVHVVSGGNALSYIGHHLLRDAPCQALNIESSLLVNFLLEIQRGYIATNPYHNAIHAADVMQTVHYFLIQPELQPYLRPLDRALSLIAAGVHDFMHDGFNNGFHISTASEIALRYNDHAVLENYHVAQSFLVMKNSDLNVLGQLAPDDFKYARDMIIQMVLATDMAKHFEDVALFKTNILSAALDEGAVLVKNVGDKKLLLKMILHTCDVSNPAKERETMLRWTDRVVEEFFVQGEMEKQLGLPVSPFMDRDTIVIKKMQVGFADFIVSPLFSVWAQILVNINSVAYRTLLANREFWASLSEDFKPHMIKDVIRDLGVRRQRDTLTQSTIPEEPVSPRSRRSVADMLLGTDDG